MTGELLPWLGGARLRIVLRAADSGGALTLIEFHCDEGYVAAPHVHAREDEAFVVLAGRMVASVDGRPTVCEAGESVWLPRGRPHGFEVTRPQTRLLHVSLPGGLDSFFTDASRLVEHGPGAVQELARSYGIDYPPSLHR